MIGEREVFPVWKRQPEAMRWEKGKQHNVHPERLESREHLSISETKEPDLLVTF